MSDEQSGIQVTDLGAIPTTVIAPESIEGALIPAAEIKPEAIGALSVRYVDGQPVLVVNGGTVLPAELPVVNAQGTQVATYTGTRPQPVIMSRSLAEPSGTKTYDNLRYVFEYEFNPDA